MNDGDGGWKAVTLLIREVCMLKLMEDLTNKPDWWDKVNDPEIVARWKAEALAMDWHAYLTYGDFTENMVDHCLAELRRKAVLYQETGLIPVIDYSACVIKSDSLISEDLRQALLDGVKPLEDVPEEKRDWHPGSNGQVLDLVHPSLYPLVYGRSHVVPDRLIGLSDAIASTSQGIVVPEPDLTARINPPSRGWHGYEGKPLPSVSTKFQWLPCNVSIGHDGAPKIQSYINNLHPEDHKDLYPVIERFIAKALPAWDLVYRWPQEFPIQRLRTMTVVGIQCTTPEACVPNHCGPTNRPVDDDEPGRAEGEDFEQDYEGSDRARRDRDWFMRTHTPNVPDMPSLATDGEGGEGGEDREEREEREYDAGYDAGGTKFKLTPQDVKTKAFFNGAKQIQVIVKLANIHLTPDKPSYDGGSWHTEGQLNERICATALFYYDSDNITDCHLDFRTKADREHMMMELDHEQSDHSSIERTFNIASMDHTMQDVGSVLTRPGRALFFPNLFQHHVSPFRLADPSRPGHRKILALFLVDPNVPILSTANVPPQREDWWHRASRFDEVYGRLPPEIASMVRDRLDFVFSEHEAKHLREELMAERKVLLKDMDNQLRRVLWNFCEH
jgi:hypothetical protein